MSYLHHCFLLDSREPQWRESSKKRLCPCPGSASVITHGFLRCLFYAAFPTEAVSFTCRILPAMKGQALPTCKSRDVLEAVIACSLRRKTFARESTLSHASSISSFSVLIWNGLPWLCGTRHFGSEGWYSTLCPFWRHTIAHHGGKRYIRARILDMHLRQFSSHFINRSIQDHFSSYTLILFLLVSLLFLYAQLRDFAAAICSLSKCICNHSTRWPKSDSRSKIGIGGSGHWSL